MQCASFTAITMSPLVYTCLQMAFSLQHGFWPTRNVSTSISVSTFIRKEHLLNDKPLKRSNLILKRRNQWRNSAGLNQVRKFGLRLLTARGHIHENILLLYSYRYSTPNMEQTVCLFCIINTLSVKSKQPPCPNYTLKISIIMQKWNNRPIKITTRFSGSDVTGRHFGSGPWEPGHEPKAAGSSG